MNYVEQYLAAIHDGSVIVSKRVRHQYEKLVDQIHHPGRYVFDERRANRPIEFIERFCKQSKGEFAGHPLTLELFQKAFISALFGFVDKETGCRKYRETLFYVARKNGKTVMLAGIALYMLMADGERGAEVYTVATKRDQAKICFEECLNMVSQSNELAALLKKRKSDLYFPATLSKMQPLGKNSNSLDGLNASLVIIDELHAIRDRNLYEVMKQSQSARRQPLLVMITTAGATRENIFDSMYHYATAVCDGTIEDETFLPILYELDQRSEWTDPKVWPKANPGLGVIKKEEDLKQKVERARQAPDALTGILVKDFNVICNSSAMWLQYEDYTQRPGTPSFTLDQFKHHYAIGGADLSRTTDLTAATLLFLDEEGYRYVEQMYWLPEDRLEEHIKRDKIPYDIWRARGLLRLCSGNTINYSDVTAWFVEIYQKYDICPLYVYYDAWSAQYWKDEMSEAGFKMVKCIQGMKTLSLPMQTLGADFRAGKIRYNDNPILKWCIGNTAVKEDVNGNIQPQKSNDPRRRIDGLASLLDAYVGLCDHYNEYFELIKAGGY